VTVNELSGETIKAILEDVADNLFNPDPYYQQGGDMVRVGGLQYSLEPAAKSGSRIGDLRLNGRMLEADKRYKVAGWAPVSDEARTAGGEPVWDLVARYLKAQKTVAARAPAAPRLIGVAGNPGRI
jgi:sulfur-oxidizing protein SoxB